MERRSKSWTRSPSVLNPTALATPLETFKCVALAGSAQNTLSEFRFYTSRSWNPNYSFLLSFHQLKEVEIEFSCEDRCSSGIDDGIVANLAEVMPKLEILRPGKAPCAAPRLPRHGQWTHRSHSSLPLPFHTSYPLSGDELGRGGG